MAWRKLCGTHAGTSTFVCGSVPCMETHREMASCSKVTPDGVIAGTRMTSCVIGHRNSCGAKTLFIVDGHSRRVTESEPSTSSDQLAWSLQAAGRAQRSMRLRILSDDVSPWTSAAQTGGTIHTGGMSGRARTWSGMSRGAGKCTVARRCQACSGSHRFQLLPCSVSNLPNYNTKLCGQLSQRL
jgi:hypothetical protein